MYVKPNKGGMPVVKIPETIKSGCVHPTYFLSEWDKILTNMFHFKQAKDSLSEILDSATRWWCTTAWLFKRDTAPPLLKIYPFWTPDSLPFIFQDDNTLWGLWPSGEFTTKLYTDVMKSNICCAMNYEMLFSFRILLLQSVLTIFPFIWLLTL